MKKKYINTTLHSITGESYYGYPYGVLFIKWCKSWEFHKGM